MINNIQNIARNATETSSIDIEELIRAFEEYFFEGPGTRYNPMGASRPKKPARSLNNELSEMGFDVVHCSLEQTDYKVRVVTSYGDNFNYETVIIDYWNCSVYTE